MVKVMTGLFSFHTQTQVRLVMSKVGCFCYVTDNDVYMYIHSIVTNPNTACRLQLAHKNSITPSLRIGWNVLSLPTLLSKM